MSTNSSRYINSGILIHHPFIHSGIPHVNEEELPRVITWMCLIDIISSEGSQTSEIRHCMNPSVLWSRSKGGCLLGLSIDWIGEGNVTPLHNFCIVENGVIADLIIFITVVSNHSKCIHYASHHIRNKCLIFFLPTPHAP